MSPPVICLLSTYNEQLFTSLQKLYNVGIRVLHGEERIDGMTVLQVLWGSLGICPPLDHIGLPCHTVEELHSISCLKVWGDVQKLHPGMVYLLVQIDDTSKATTYSMALVWISPLQARVSSMMEALEILSSLTSEGSDRP